MNLDASRVAELFVINEARLPKITYGLFGVCLACYRLDQMTKHHIAPRSVLKNRDWRPFNVMLCRRCHSVLHQVETNHDLYAKCKTLADVVTLVRNCLTA